MLFLNIQIITFSCICLFSTLALHASAIGYISQQIQAPTSVIHKMANQQTKAVQFNGPEYINDEEKAMLNGVRFRKLSEIDIQVTVTRLCLIVIFLTIINTTVLVFEFFTGQCIYQHFNLTEEFLLVKVK